MYKYLFNSTLVMVIYKKKSRMVFVFSTLLLQIITGFANDERTTKD